MFLALGFCSGSGGKVAKFEFKKKWNRSSLGLLSLRKGERDKLEVGIYSRRNELYLRHLGVYSTQVHMITYITNHHRSWSGIMVRV